MILYNYHCLECEEQFEAFRSMENRSEAPCPHCGEFAPFVQSPVRFKLEGITGHFPTAYDKWAKVHEKEAKRDPR